MKFSAIFSCLGHYYWFSRRGWQDVLFVQPSLSAIVLLSKQMYSRYCNDDSSQFLAMAINCLGCKYANGLMVDTSCTFLLALKLHLDHHFEWDHSPVYCDLYLYLCKYVPMVNLSSYTLSITTPWANLFINPKKMFWNLTWTLKLSCLCAYEIFSSFLHLSSFPGQFLFLYCIRHLVHIWKSEMPLYPSLN